MIENTDSEHLQINSDKTHFSENIKETENFTRKYNHLPGVPSAKEVKKQGGILINRSTEINLEKIEELHLHLFEMNSKCKDFEKRISHLEEKL